MSPDQMIAVIDAHRQGKELQVRTKPYGQWSECKSPSFNFYCYEYRVKPAEPREWWVVPESRVLLNAMPSHPGAIKVREVIE